MYIYIYLYIHICMYACMYVYIYTCTCIYTCTVMVLPPFCRGPQVVAARPARRVAALDQSARQSAR